ncbi:hypothetical protein RFI_38728 [Reticulomyxa filosa]|uniref:Uncharacterized protein n=1 Tax=Reticulomyxa filosa TaxID=46433 RepID=X6LDD7_RETFI|nr:hypothetical protein RFI_38728 [Reticulomyxa filosa]|eukprot:ETN98759.1 hypothetical protein RFI_38728 [Reticulomyxa filosa]
MHNIDDLSVSLISLYLMIAHYQYVRLRLKRNINNWMIQLFMRPKFFANVLRLEKRQLVSIWKVNKPWWSDTILQKKKLLRHLPPYKPQDPQLNVKEPIWMEFSNGKKANIVHIPKLDRDYSQCNYQNHHKEINVVVDKQLLYQTQAEIRLIYSGDAQTADL